MDSGSALGPGRVAISEFSAVQSPALRSPKRLTPLGTASSILRLRRFALVALAVLVPRSLLAEPRATAHVEWTKERGASTCSDGERLAHLVEERLGRAVFVARDAADVTVRGRFERTVTGFRAVLDLSRGNETLGERVLDTSSSTCAELDAPVALVLAVAIESVTVKRVEVKLPSPAQTSSEPRPRRASPPPKSTPVPKGAAWRAELAAGGAFALGPLPKPAWGFTVQGFVAPPSFVPVRGDVRIWLPRDAEVPARPGGGASFSAWQAGLAVCPLFLPAAGGFELAACAGGTAGMLSAASHDLDRNAEARGMLLGTELQARATLARGRARPWLELGAEAPFVRDRFQVNVGGDAEEVHQPSALWFVVRAGALLAVP